MMKLLFIIIAFVTFFYHSEGIEVVCQYDEIDIGYYCKVQNSPLITSKDDREISSIGVKSWDHWRGRTDESVIGFYSSGIIVKFVPRGVTKFFKNLISLWIAQAELEEVTKEDLKEFGVNLKHLFLDGNKIEKIDADLFEYNPNLITLRLSNNQITHIDDGAFDGLEQLKGLWVMYNPCTEWDDYAYFDRTKVPKVIESVQGKCKIENGTTIEPETS